MKLIKLKEEHYVVENNDGVITYSTDINFNEVYYIPLSEVKELLGEVDVEKRAKENYVEPLNKQGEKRAQLVGNNGLFGFNKFKKAFKKGYNQALEDNKEKKYTEEDLADAINMARNEPDMSGNAIIQSLQPKTEWEVEFINGKLTLKQ